MQAPPSVEDHERLARGYDAALYRQWQQLRQLQGYVDKYDGLIDTLDTLPDTLSQPIMVPLGPHAFFPGQLKHPNELLVLLGENYFAKRTAKQTKDIIQRRRDAIQGDIETVKEAMRDTKEKLGFLHEMVGEKEESGLVDIREEYNSDEEDSDDDSDYEEANRQQQQANAVNQEAISAMFARLEAQEAAALAAEKASTQAVADGAPAFSSPADIYNQYMNQQTQAKQQSVQSSSVVDKKQKNTTEKSATATAAPPLRGILKNTGSQPPPPRQTKVPLGAKESSAFSGEIKERPVAPVVKDTITPADSTSKAPQGKPKRQSKFMQNRRK